MFRLIRCTRFSAVIAGAVALTVAAASCHNSTGPKASQVTYNGGNNQTATAGTLLPIKPSVLVTDQAFAPVEGFLIIFSVTGGGGHITGDSAYSNANGIATVGSWRLGTTPGPNQLTVSAFGLSGNGIKFLATGN